MFNRDKALYKTYVQKQPSRGVLKKSVLKIRNKLTVFCSANLLFNFIEIALRHGRSPVNLLHIFRTLFFKNISGRLLLTSPKIYW